MTEAGTARCWGWHDWTKWSDAEPYGLTYVQQMKVCRRCNKARLRTSA